MQRPQSKYNPGIVSRAMEHSIEHLLHARLSEAVQVSKNCRVRLSQQLGSSCRQAIVAYLDDEVRTMSVAFASDELKAEFNRRHHNIRALLDQLDDMDPTQNTVFELLGKTAKSLDEYVAWAESVLYPAVEKLLEDKELQKVLVMKPELTLPLIGM